MKTQTTPTASKGRTNGRPAVRTYPYLETNMGPYGKPVMKIYLNRKQLKSFTLPMECKAPKNSWNVATKRFAGSMFAAENLALDTVERMFTESKETLTTLASVEKLNTKMRNVVSEVINGTYVPEPAAEPKARKRRAFTYRRKGLPGLSVTRRPNGSVTITITKLGLTRTATVAYVKDPSVWDSKAKRVVGDDPDMVNKRMDAIEKVYARHYDKVMTVKGLESLRDKMLAASRHVAKKAERIGPKAPNAEAPHFIDTKSWHWRTVREGSVTIDEMVRFQFHEHNRAVAQERIAKVKSKCIRLGMDGMPQLRVESKHLWVLDGQARILAIKQLYDEGYLSPDYRVPVKFMEVDENYVVDCIHEFNAGDTSKWSQNDWVRSYISQGDESYARLHNFSVSHRLTMDGKGRPKYRYACAVIKGKSDDRCIKNGNLTISDDELALAERVYAELETIVDTVLDTKVNAEFIPLSSEWHKVRNCHPFEECLEQLKSMKARVAKAKPTTSSDWCAVFDAMNSALTKKAANASKAAE